MFWFVQQGWRCAAVSSRSLIFSFATFFGELDAKYDVSYAGTLAVHIYLRKQDTARKGLYPRICIASRAVWDIA